MIQLIRNTLHPAIYHGYTKPPPFFEGWYYKLVDSTETHRYAIIPGVFLSSDPAKHHAFVQVLNGVTGHSTYHRYPPAEFWSAKDRFDIRIGPNRFSAEALSIEIDSPEIDISGTLHFGELHPWPVTLWSPGIMGWYAWVPFMECYHGVVSLDHRIDGSLTVNGQSIELTGGRGYIEKDWGRRFPETWVWLQTNHFDRPGASLTASVAIIPWLRRSFAGFIVGLWHQNVLYRFATYTGARIEKLDVADESLTWIIQDREYQLEMRVSRTEGAILHAPTTNDMGRRIAETLNAQVEVTLSSLKNGAPTRMFSDIGRHAGLEVVGDMEKLASQA